MVFLRANGDSDLQRSIGKYGILLPSVSVSAPENKTSFSTEEFYKCPWSQTKWYLLKSHFWLLLPFWSYQKAGNGEWRVWLSDRSNLVSEIRTANKDVQNSNQKANNFLGKTFKSIKNPAKITGGVISNMLINYKCQQWGIHFAKINVWEHVFLKRVLFVLFRTL